MTVIFQRRLSNRWFMYWNHRLVPFWWFLVRWSTEFNFFLFVLLWPFNASLIISLDLLLRMVQIILFQLLLNVLFKFLASLQAFVVVLYVLTHSFDAFTRGQVFLSDHLCVEFLDLLTEFAINFVESGLDLFWSQISVCFHFIGRLERLVKL